MRGQQREPMMNPEKAKDFFRGLIGRKPGSTTDSSGYDESGNYFEKKESTPAYGAGSNINSALQYLPGGVGAAARLPELIEKHKETVPNIIGGTARRYGDKDSSIVQSLSQLENNPERYVDDLKGVGMDAGVAALGKLGGTAIKGAEKAFKGAGTPAMGLTAQDQIAGKGKELFEFLNKSANRGAKNNTARVAISEFRALPKAKQDAVVKHVGAANAPQMFKDLYRLKDDNQRKRAVKVINKLVPSEALSNPRFGLGASGLKSVSSAGDSGFESALKAKDKNRAGLLMPEIIRNYSP